jgi:hypothetical protein
MPESMAPRRACAPAFVASAGVIAAPTMSSIARRRLTALISIVIPPVIVSKPQQFGQVLAGQTALNGIQPN